MTFLAGEPFFAAIAGALRDRLREVSRSRTGRMPSSSRSRSAPSASAAIQLLPFLEMLRGSDRAARLAPEQIFRESMALRDWLRIVIPPTFSASALDPSLSQHFIAVIYIGIPAVVLAIIAVVRSPVAGLQGCFASADKPSPATAARPGWLALLLFAVIVAAGNRLPFAGNAVAQLPLTLFRYPARLVPFGALAIAALAAMGWDRIRPDRRWADLLLVLIIVADLLPRERPLFQTNPFSTNIVPYVTSIGRQSKIIRMPRKADHESLRVDRRISQPLSAPLRRGDGGAGRQRPVPPPSRLGADGRAWRSVRSHRRGVHPRRRDGARAAGGCVERSGHGVFQSVRAADGDVLDARGVVRVTGRRSSRAIDIPIVPRSSFRRAWARNLRRRSPGDVHGICLARYASGARRHRRAEGWNRDADAAGFAGVARLRRRCGEKKLLAAGNFRAVAVTKGKHDVQWRYHSSSLAFGMGMTAITSALLLLSKFVKRIAAKKFS